MQTQIHDVVFITIRVTSIVAGVLVVVCVVVVVGVVVVVCVVVVVGVAIVEGVVANGDKHESGLVIGFLLANKHEEHDRTLV